ncbi:cell adhesion molecule 2-like [Prorops nasuta]|uniref:cell adhesion molecule 2-like n=1 Tax=Prorops nasuta TaxID=863751 RepID=UPI0034CEC0A2
MFLQVFVLLANLLPLPLLSGIVALRMTALQIPQHVVVNETVRMECNFNLDKEVLYSVKWYKDGHEFYRYLPRDEPTVQTFPLAGVNVNSHKSTERSVVLNNVQLSSGGRYRCEVSAEAPAFQTVSDHADMTVVVLPKDGPRISGRRTKYQIGDVVRKNCTSAPSKPAAQLKWYINEEPADTQYLRGPHIISVDERGLGTAVLGLQFRVMSKHFKRGDIKLKCSATIAKVYSRSNEESEEGEERILKAPVMESRGTRAQSHTRNDLTNESPATVSVEWLILLLIAGTPLIR